MKMLNQPSEPRSGGSRIKIVSRKDWKVYGMSGVLRRADGGLVNIQGGSDTLGVCAVILDCVVYNDRMCLLFNEQRIRCQMIVSHLLNEKEKASC